jgi:D-alanyl-D-alanine carboxypeptidase
MRPFECLKFRSRLRLLCACLLTVLVATSALPGSADLKQELEKLRQQQQQIQDDKKAKAAEINVATAEADELGSALEVLNASVNAQAAKVSDAEQRLAAAKARHDSAVEAVLAQTAVITDLEADLEDSAINSFVNQDRAHSVLLEEANPNKAVRMQSLAEAVTESGISVADQLLDAKEDLQIEQAEAADAADEAARIQTQLTAELAELETQKEQQQSLVDEAEQRLESELAEAAALAELDQELSNQIVAKNTELARQQAAAAARRRSNPAPSSGATGFPSAADIVSVRGFWVHRDIAPNLDDMLAAAEADGIHLGGGGYRDSQNQVRLRKAHCGASDYAVYQMPASQCSPPTARPGQSMHEQGKAIDFTFNGSIIASSDNAGYQWLAAHANRYGLYNLPSERWHWSTNGK